MSGLLACNLSQMTMLGRDSRPVVLQKTASTKSADGSSVKLSLALGSLVQFNECPGVSAMKNSFGAVTSISWVDVTVTLSRGARVEKVRPDDLCSPR